MRILLTILITTTFITGLRAQFVSDYKRVADLYFQDKEYYAAAQYYKKALNITGDSLDLSKPYSFDNKSKHKDRQKSDKEKIIFKLGESYRLYKDFASAQKWYAVSKEFTDSIYVLSHFYYAESLRANKKFHDAIDAFETFLKVYNKQDDYTAMAKLEIESSKLALKEMRYPRLVSLNKLPDPVNQQGSNYAPLKQNSTLYFTSSRPVNVTGKKQTIGSSNVPVKKKETPYLNNIYSIEGDLSQGNSYTTLKKVEFEIPEKENAAAGMSPDGNTIYFTAWTGKGEDKTYHIYTAAKQGAKWTQPESAGLQVNIKGFNAMQPHITSNGKYLIFSSDRPGGFGKYDLWYTPIRTDGTLGQAINMGNTINTEEDEQAPYYNPKTQKLLFSSNGRIGLGGFDFFESEGNFSTWTTPSNLGFPFNSSKDDMYFTATDANGDEGYISSDRESVCCLELFHIKKEYFAIKGTIIDCETKQPVGGAIVSLSDSLNNNKLILDESGEYSFRLNTPRPLKLIVEKEGYFTNTISYTYGDLAKRDTLLNPGICLTPLVINKPITLSDIYYDFNSADLNDSSKNSLKKLVKIMNDNAEITIELSAHTDNVGSDLYNMDLSQRRAQSCVDYLISEGIVSSRISAKGYGESMPIAPNTIKGKDHPEGRKLNRRTEFKVVKK